MIIEAIYDNELKGKYHKVGTRMQVTDDYGHFLVTVNQNWKYVKGASTLEYERKIHEEIERMNEKADRTGAKESKKTSKNK